MTNEKPGKLVRARGIVNGYEATLQVTEAEAKRRGLEIITPTAAKTKARSPEPATADVKTKTRSTTRKASTKKAGA